jgi:cytoskeleton protein RodZ
LSEPQENITVPADVQESATVGAGETVQAEEHDQVQDRAQTLGQVLRAGREAAHLSVEDVARSVKFSVRQVEALEADDYAALPGNTIVRGFARSYGRLLKLEESALLALLNAALPSAVPTEVRTPDNMGDATEPEGLQKLPWLASLAIVILLATALLALWHFLVPGSPKPAVTTAVTSQRSAGDSPVAADAPAAPVSPLAAPAAEPAPPVPAEQSAATPLPAEGKAPQPSAESSAPALVFVFGNRSWLEVIDANKQMLHTGENPAGTQLVLRGRPPFDIVIGNAGQVRLTYNGREVDLVPHTRADVARFKLEQ